MMVLFRFQVAFLFWEGTGFAEQRFIFVVTDYHESRVFGAMTAAVMIFVLSGDFVLE